MGVEECVYWLCVVHRRGYANLSPKPVIDCIVTRNVKVIREWAKLFLTNAKECAEADTRRELLTVWALCRAAIRAIAAERGARG